MKNIFFALFLSPFILFSQNLKKAEKSYDKAVDFYQSNNSKKAKELAQSAIHYDIAFLKPHLLLGQIEEESANFQKAIEHYLTGISDNNPKNAWGYWKVGTLYMALGKYQKAQNNFYRFLQFDNQPERYVISSQHELLNCGFAIEALKNPVLYNPKNLGPEINSSFEEYLPSISADGNMFVITRRGPHSNNIVSEDFFVSYKENGMWQEALNMGSAVNTNGNEGAQCLSADGEILFFTACDREDGLGRCDIYVSFKSANGWTKARNLGSNVNSNGWDSQPSYSPDGRELYFVSNRAGGIGKMDIWKSILGEDGIFSKPINLGPTINTPYDEMSPFIHTDNQNLYFASSGHPGMGDFDLFVSKREYPNAKWSSPTNLGYPINTYGIENSLIVASDGKTAYFASDKSGFGQEDIFWFNLPREARASQVAYLKTKVADALSNAPLGSKLELIDLSSGQLLMESFTSKRTGELFTCLPANSNYALNVSKDGYLFHSENFSLNQEGAQQAMELDILLQPIKKGNSVILQNIFFDTGKFTLKDESQVELKKLLTFLINNPNIQIEIEGHTDNVGSEEYNNLLSMNRSKQVMDYLVESGIDDSRLSNQGFGSSQPIATNDTEEGRSKNRRTAFRIK